MRRIIALAASVATAWTFCSDAVEAQSYKERGYGGPLYVGPNFEQGGQHTTPDFGSKSNKKAATSPALPKRVPRDSAKAKKPPTAPSIEAAETPAPRDTTTQIAAPASPDADVVSGTGTTTAGVDAGAAPACKRFDSTTGQTFTVPCE